MKTFKAFITEKKDIVNPKDIKLFGKVLFGDFQQDKENDTVYEKNVFNVIKDFIGGDSVGTNKEKKLEDFLLVLSKFKKMWPDILVPDKTILYRGTGIRKEDIFKMEVKKETISADKNFMVIGPHTYKSRSKIQSWTTEMKAALNFAVFFPKENYKDNIPVVLRGKPKEKNLIFSDKFLNKLSTAYLGYKEYEVIRFTNSPIKTDVIIHKKLYEKIMKK